MGCTSITASAKTADKRILLLTNEDDPFGNIKGLTKLDMARATLQRAKDAQDFGISIELLPLSTPNEEFNVSYGNLYAESGFQTVLQVHYRSFLEQVEPPKETAVGLKVEAPALFIMGEEDYVFKFPGMEEYLKSGEVMKYVPNLEIVYLPEGSHFVHE